MSFRIHESHVRVQTADQKGGGSGHEPGIYLA